eukprot:4008003-Amphidinium_carterae.1
MNTEHALRYAADALLEEIRFCDPIGAAGLLTRARECDPSNHGVLRHSFRSVFTQDPTFAMDARLTPTGNTMSRQIVTVKLQCPSCSQGAVRAVEYECNKRQTIAKEPSLKAFCLMFKCVPSIPLSQREQSHCWHELRPSTWKGVAACTTNSPHQHIVMKLSKGHQLDA